MEIIRTDPGLEFWENMALQEQGAKGKRGKELRLVLPSGYEDLLSCGEHDAESESEEEDRVTDEEEHKEAIVDHVEPVTDVVPNSSNGKFTIRSFSDSRAAQGIQFRQTLGVFPDPGLATFASDSIPFADRENSTLGMTKKFQPCIPLMPHPSSSRPALHPSDASSLFFSSSLIPLHYATDYHDSQRSAQG